MILFYMIAEEDGREAREEKWNKYCPDGEKKFRACRRTAYQQVQPLQYLFWNSILPHIKILEKNDFLKAQAF